MRRLISCLVVTAPALCATSTAQEQVLTDAEAIKLATAVSTAETESIARDKHALDLNILSNHKFVQNLGMQIESAQDGSPNSMLVKGYEVRLTLTRDGNQYTLTLIPKTPGCQPIYVTNESGQLYKGVSIGCGVALQGRRGVQDDPAPGPAF